MLREEADREAERRNHEDPDRGRYEFYAFDESAGMAQDAWDIARRLRDGPPPTSEWPGLGPQTPAGGAPESESQGPPEPRAPQPAEPPLPLEGPTIAEIDPFAGPDPFVEPALYDEPLHPAEPLPYDEAVDDGRPGLFVRGVAVAVVVAGLAWMALVIVLATVLKPNSTTSVGAFVALAFLGILAILLGVAIRRS
jgi:hypothetical protein